MGLYATFSACCLQACGVISGVASSWERFGQACFLCRVTLDEFTNVRPQRSHTAAIIGNDLDKTRTQSTNT